MFVASFGLLFLYFFGPILLKYLYSGYSIDPELLGTPLLLTFYINGVAQLLGFGPDVKSKLDTVLRYHFFRAIVVVIIVSNILQNVRLKEFIFTYIF